MCHEKKKRKPPHPRAIASSVSTRSQHQNKMLYYKVGCHVRLCSPCRTNDTGDLRELVYQPSKYANGCQLSMESETFLSFHL